MTQEKKRLADNPVFRIVINALLVLIWTYLAWRKYSRGQTGWDFWLSVLCAVLWLMTTIIYIRQYLKSQEQNRS